MQHPKASLPHAAVRTADIRKLMLHEGGKVQTLVDILILHQFKHDIGIYRIGVESFVGGLIIVFEQHYRILAHSYIQVGLHLIHTQHKGFRTGHIPVFGRVGMDADKEIGVVFIHDIRTLLEGEEDVVLARHYHFYVRMMQFDLLLQPLAYLQIQFLFLREFPHRTGIMTAMTRINHHRKSLFLSCFLSRFTTLLSR